MSMPMRREVGRALATGLVATLLLGAAILIGSRRLSHFDAALVAYTFALLFSTFGLTYRYCMWLQRPPTSMFWKRGWQAFFLRGFKARNLANWFRWTMTDFVLSRFIWSRGRARGLAHWLIMWGCVLAVLITFPLVFGWLHFETPGQDLERYQAVLFGFPTFSFSVHSWFGFILFHGLVWSALMVIAGGMLAMRRRMREEGAVSLQLFSEDFLPLILLFAVSLTGLMLTASYSWLKGYAYDFMAVLHALTVILTFLWIPFGKLFHVFQRPAQLGARFYKEIGHKLEPAHCRRCGHAFTSLMHVRDLIEVEKDLGYRYEMQGPTEHYQWVCPPCRRAMFALAQGRLWGTNGAIAVAAQPPTPCPANRAHGSGPLGTEDSANFHP